MRRIASFEGSGPRRSMTHPLPRSPWTDLPHYCFIYSLRGISGPRATVLPCFSPFVEFVRRRSRQCWRPSPHSCSSASKTGFDGCLFVLRDYSTVFSSSSTYSRQRLAQSSYLCRCLRSSEALAGAWQRRTSWSVGSAQHCLLPPNCSTSCYDAGKTAASLGAICGSFGSMILGDVVNSIGFGTPSCSIL